jgi:hypothetical protein
MLIIRWTLDENNRLTATFVRAASAARRSDRLRAAAPPRVARPALPLAQADVVNDVAVTAGACGSQDDRVGIVTGQYDAGA